MNPRTSRLHRFAGVLTLTLGVWVGRAVAEPSVQPASATVRSDAPSAAPAVPATRGSQAIRGDDVLIEGKLYSPQALFILSRTAETFGRDAIVPHTLGIAPSKSLAPYRLRTEGVGGMAAGEGTAPGHGTTAVTDSTALDEH